MSIVVSGLLNGALVTKGYSGEENTLDSITLPIQSVVTVTDKYKTLTGLYATEDDITGWIYDMRRVEDWNLLSTRYNTFLGGHRAGLKDNTYLSDWQSGVVIGLKYKGLGNYIENGALTWTPMIDIGQYSIYWDVRNLYSDYSTSQNVNVEINENGLNTIYLRDDAVLNTIQAAIWLRTKDYLILKAKEFQYVDTFTGEMDTNTNSRLSTEDDNGNILIDNLAGRKYEFVVRDGKVVFNNDYRINVGTTDVELSITNSTLIKSLWEFKGSNTNDRTLLTNFFPLQTGTVQLITERNNVFTTWTEVSSLNFSGPGDRHYTVDEDLGIIQLGGFKADNLILLDRLTETATELSVYANPKVMAQYPEQGILTINNEQILYYGKTANRFLNLVRGYNGTESALHSEGSIVEDIQHGARSTDRILIAYTAVPRIDYEVTDYTLRSCNKGSWLDLQPTKNVLTNNVLQLLSSEINLAQVILETDSPNIGGSLYGPVYYGTDISKLTARGLDAHGNPVDNITLHIDILSGKGSLNGSLHKYSALSNTLGEIYAFYNAPYSGDELEQIVSKTEHQSGNTLMTVKNLQSGTLPSDIWVYQILKHDATIGTVGLKGTIVAQDLTVAMPHGNGAFELDVLIDHDDYRGGWLYYTGTDNVSYYKEIVTLWDAENGDGVLVTYIGLNSLPNGVTAVGQSCRLYKWDATEWNSTLLNGSKVILYEYTQDAIHPITLENGAYTPLHPNSIVGNKIIFNNRTLGIPDPANNDLNLGGYCIIAPSEVKIQAWGKDPVSGKVIKSNVVRLALELPSFLVGVDESGILPIPYGWTLVSEDFNIGAGLGGANFITINPSAEGINQFVLTGVI